MSRMILTLVVAGLLLTGMVVQSFHVDSLLSENQELKRQIGVHEDNDKTYDQIMRQAVEQITRLMEVNDALMKANPCHSL